MTSESTTRSRRWRITIRTTDGGTRTLAVSSATRITARAAERLYASHHHRQGDRHILTTRPWDPEEDGA